MRKIKDEGDEKFYNCDFIMIYCEKRQIRERKLHIFISFIFIREL